MPTVLEQLSNFLRARSTACNGDLIARWTPAMETQVNVSAGRGEPVKDKRSTYTDGVNEWWNIRVPRKADSEPEFRDYQLNWAFGDHAEGIGSTGWDWRSRASRWLGFDFDSITGHAAGVGVTDDELNRVRAAASALPWVEVRKSTGGKGLHLYVLFDQAGVPTANHTEHAALGRAILGWMSSEAGFDFASQIDAAGGNMWIWHRKMSPENEGLKLLKPAEKILSVADLPPNWRDHIEVVTRRRAKVRVQGVSGDDIDPFEALASARRIVPLTPKHKQVIDELSSSGFSTVWLPDYHLLHTHTCALQKLFEKDELGLVGVFKTSSNGRDPGTPNCFAFPLDAGGWKVYRFSQGVSEAQTWTQDREGWTTCYFNARSDWNIAARAFGGGEMSKGGYSFKRAAEAIKVAEALGEKIAVPDNLAHRAAQLKRSKDGRLVVQLKKESSEAEPGEGWVEAKGGWWEKVLNAKTEQKRQDQDFAEYDNIIRQLVTPVGDDAGWVIRANDRSWQRFQTDKVKLRLLDLGNGKNEIDSILGSAIGKAWQLVNLPFQSEYPGNRQWNLNAAQFAFQPAVLDDDEAPYHPHWDKILAHCGRDLNEPLKELEWAQRANIKTGRDYLLAWIACLLRDPHCKLPYLFLYGEQNSGKSILHESIARLVTKGVASADRALTNQSDFNGELANCILAYIEEKDISTAPGAYNKIKDLVTSPTLWVRRMRTDAYSQPNTLHFIQCANKPGACPISANDTRITMIYVPDLEPGQEIPKEALKLELDKEAPHFMRTIMDLVLPAAEGRLRLPVVKTTSKEQAEEFSRNSMETFLAEQCYYVPGRMVDFSDFAKRFWDALPDSERPRWTKFKISKALPRKFPSGRSTANKTMIGNMSFEEAPANEPPKAAFFSVEGRLAQEGQK